MLILVVDSDQELSAAVCSALVVVCRATARAAGVTEALTLLKSGLLPDLILLDFHERETGGDALLTELANDEAFASIPVIAMMSNRADTRPARTTSALAKPFDTYQLLKAVTGHMRSRESIVPPG